MPYNGLEGVSKENISVNLSHKHEFWNYLFNRMQWEVTIMLPKMEPTVVIDVHSGDFIALFGPLN